jgi:hypothetical protein
MVITGWNDERDVIFRQQVCDLFGRNGGFGAASMAGVT